MPGTSRLVSRGSRSPSIRNPRTSLDITEMSRPSIPQNTTAHGNADPPAGQARLPVQRADAHQCPKYQRRHPAAGRP